MARLHRHADWARRRLHRPRELYDAGRRQRFLALGVQHAALYLRCIGPQIRAGSVAGADPQRAPALQILLPRHRAAALGGADGSFRPRLLVDIRCAVLDPLMVADGVGPDRPADQFPRRSEQCPRLGHRRQCLARHSLRRDLAARRPADHFRLRYRKRLRWTGRRPGSASATSRCRC